MTDKTDERILALEGLADSIRKKEFKNIPLESLVYLTSLSVISGNELKFFLDGFLQLWNVTISKPDYKK